MSNVGTDPKGYKARLSRAGTDQAEAARALGWSQTKTSRFVNGDLKRPAAEDRDRFEAWLSEKEKAAGLSDRDGAGWAGQPGHPGRSADVIPLNARRHLPVYGLAGASNGHLNLNHEAVVGTVEAPPGFDPRGDYFLVEVFGPSMEPRYFSGERAVAARNRPPRPGQDVIVELKNGDAYLKVYLATRQGVVWCDQWNKDEITEDTVLHWPLSEVKALHAVVRP